MKRNKREKKNRKKGHRYLFHHTFQALAKISNYLMHMSSLKVWEKSVVSPKREKEIEKEKEREKYKIARKNTDIFFFILSKLWRKYQII